MKTDNEDHHIINKLQKLPHIADSLSKEEMYQRVSSKMSRKTIFKQSPSGKRKIIPIFSTMLVVAIVLILIPSFINEMKAPEHHDEITKKSENMDEENNENDQSNMTMEASEEESQDEQHFDSYVLQSKNDDDLIVYGAFPDNQWQNTIPVSFVVSNTTTDLNDYYNKISDLLNEKLDVDMDLLDGITFDVEEETQEVVAHLGEQFSLDKGGSAYSSMFSNVLSFMFAPYGIEEITLESNQSTEEVELGPFGTISELGLEELTNLHFKLYEDKNSSTFLTPVAQYENNSITEALHEMKHAEEQHHLTATIPEDVDFQVEDQGAVLVITFSDQTDLEQSQQMMTMIEAMLMTAKSYGYESVQFSNTSIEKIGDYNFAEPIEVPDAVNPIY